MFDKYNNNIKKNLLPSKSFQIMTYVCSYMMKSEKAMGEVLKSVARECHSEPVAQQLKKKAKGFVGNGVFGVPEAAM